MKSKDRIITLTPKLWNLVLNIEQKLTKKHAIFKATIKLVLLENAAIVYF